MKTRDKNREVSRKQLNELLRENKRILDKNKRMFSATKEHLKSLSPVDAVQVAAARDRFLNELPDEERRRAEEALRLTESLRAQNLRNLLRNSDSLVPKSAK